jgi:hypothetical protein
MHLVESIGCLNSTIIYITYIIYVTRTFPACVVENDNVGDGAGVVNNSIAVVVLSTFLL